MPAEALALAAAVGWACEAVLIGKGIAYGSASTALLLILAVATVVLWTASAAFAPLSLLRSPAVGWFVLGGLIQPVAVRFLHYVGIQRLGASRADPVRGITPLFALLLAFLLLRERAGLAVYLGAALTMGGVWLVCRRRHGEAPWNRSDLLYPLGAAFLGAVSQALRKQGLAGFDSPLLAATVTTTTSLIAFAVVLAATGRLADAKPGRACLPYFGAAALVSTAAVILNFHALARGEVSIVVPLVNTHPLFVVLLSAVFLRETERVTASAWAGGILVVAGSALITCR